MSPAEQKYDLNHMTVNFRWVLPIMFGGYLVAWGIQQNWQNQRFDNLQKGQDQTSEQVKSIYSKIDGLQTKEASDFDYVLQHYVPMQNK